MIFWHICCGLVMTLVDTDELVVVEDVHEHLQGIHSSVVGVEITTHERNSFSRGGKALMVVLH